MHKGLQFLMLLPAPVLAGQNLAVLQPFSVLPTVAVLEQHGCAQLLPDAIQKTHNPVVFHCHGSLQCVLSWMAQSLLDCTGFHNVAFPNVDAAEW